MPKNCLVCFLKYNINNVYIFFPVKYFCPHLKFGRFSSYAHFDYSKKQLMFPIFLILCLSSFTAYNAYRLYFWTNSTTLLLEIFQILYDIHGLCTHAFLIHKISLHVKDLNGWSEIIERREYFSLINKDIITKTMIKNAARNNYVFRVLLLTGLILFTFYYFHFMPDGNAVYQVLRRFLQIYTVFIHINMFSDLTMVRVVLRRIRTMAYINIDKVFNQKLKKNQLNVQYINGNTTENCFEETVSRFRRLFSSYNVNYKVLNEMLGTSLPIYFLISLAELVVSIFTVIIYFENSNNFENFNILFIEWRIWLTLFFLTTITLNTYSDFLVSDSLYDFK